MKKQRIAGRSKKAPAPKVESNSKKGKKGY